jgi:hypothetical protein
LQVRLSIRSPNPPLHQQKPKRRSLGIPFPVLRASILEFVKAQLFATVFELGDISTLVRFQILWSTQHLRGKHLNCVRFK